MEANEALTVLQAHSDLFTTTQSIFITPFRHIGWAIIQLLVLLEEVFENAIRTIFGHLNFYNSPEMTAVFNAIRGTMAILLAIGTVWLGFQIMTNRRKEKGQIPFNFLLCLLIILGLPTVTNQLATMTGQAATAFMGTSESSLADQLIDANVNDIAYIINNEFSENSLSNHNSIDASQISSIDVGELIKPDSSTIHTGTGDVLRYHIEYNSDTGVQEAVTGDMGGNWIVGDAFSNCYYRYQINWYAIILSLLGLAIAMIICALRVAKIVFQIAYVMVFTLFVAPIDVVSGQRLKKCLQELFGMFIMLMSVAMMFRLYLIGVNWIVGAGFDAFTQAILFLGMSWALISGPTLIPKILGIDSEFGSVGRAMTKALFASKVGGGMVKSGAKTVRNAAGKTFRGATSTAGAMAGGARAFSANRHTFSGGNHSAGGSGDGTPGAGTSSHAPGASGASGKPGSPTSHGTPGVGGASGSAPSLVQNSNTNNSGDAYNTATSGSTNEQASVNSAGDSSYSSASTAVNNTDNGAAANGQAPGTQARQLNSTTNNGNFDKNSGKQNSTGYSRNSVASKALRSNAVTGSFMRGYDKGYKFVGNHTKSSSNGVAPSHYNGNAQNGANYNGNRGSSNINRPNSKNK